MGLHNPELSNCERTTHRSTNCGEYQLPQTHIIQNIIIANQSDNSEIQITLPAPETNIHHSSKEVMRTSIPKIKYNLRNHNNTNYHSKYAGHIDGTNNKNKKNSSQRKIGEGRKCTDQGKCIQSTVPPPYVPVQKSKSFQTSKRSPAYTVSSPYLRENKETVSASKNSQVPQSFNSYSEQHQKISAYSLQQYHHPRNKYSNHDWTFFISKIIFFVIPYCSLS